MTPVPCEHQQAWLQEQAFNEMYTQFYDPSMQTWTVVERRS